MTITKLRNSLIFLFVLIVVAFSLYKITPQEIKKPFRAQLVQYWNFTSDSVADSYLLRKTGTVFGWYENMDPGWKIGDGANALQATFRDPTGIYVDKQDRVFISERRRHRVRLVENGKITTFAGNGRLGFTADNTHATNSRFNRPEGLDGDSKGNIYITDSFNHRIRRVSADGTISTVAGTGTPGYSGDGGPAISASLHSPMDVKLGPSGSFYILERDNHSVRRVSPDGTITTIVGNGKPGSVGDGGPATKAQLNEPYGIAVDNLENVYIADSKNNRVRKIDQNGIITTIAGTGVVGYSGDGGPAIAAQFDSPQALAFTPEQDLVINDEHNHKIRKILKNGTIVTIAGSTKGFSGDGGNATKAQLNDPEYIWVDHHGNLFITDGDNNRIRKVSASGLVSTIAGSGN